jgi:enoyl-CoA hydratase/carnithine racemase
LLTHRIELNAFPSDRLIAWIEGKLEAAGVRKVVPDDDMLARAARDYARQMFEDRMLEEAREEIAEQAEEIEIDGCREAIEEMLAEDRGLAWDEALRLFVKEKLDS